MAWRMRWLGTACFEILLPDRKTLVTDPYLDDAVAAPITSDEIEHCDYIFITHGHYDHVLDVGKLVRRFEPKVFCNQTAAEALARHQGVDPQRLHMLRVGDRVEEPNLTIEVLRGVHVDFAKEHKRLTGKDLNSEPGAGGQARRVFGPVRLPAKMSEWMANYPAASNSISSSSRPAAAVFTWPVPIRTLLFWKWRPRPGPRSPCCRSWPTTRCAAWRSRRPGLPWPRAAASSCPSITTRCWKVLSRPT